MCVVGDERLENLFLCPILGLLACFSKQQPGHKNILLTWQAFSDLQTLTVDGGTESTSLYTLPAWAPESREETKFCFYERGPRVETEEPWLQELFELSDS